MLDDFKLWSEKSEEAKNKLSPELGLRSWNDLLNEEKEKVLKYLSHLIDFYNFDQELWDVIYELNQKHRYHSPGEAVLNSLHLKSIPNYNERKQEIAWRDFQEIILNKEGCVVLELLSIIATRFSKDNFNYFAKQINEIFEDFGVNKKLTKLGFIPRQEEKIVEKIYTPVIKVLSEERWKKINSELSDAFEDYRNGDYSSSITHAVCSLEAFLKIELYESTDKGPTLGKLISEAIKEGIISDDKFTRQIFKNIEKILMKERQEKGDPHPKKEYASEENAKLILNLTMVFLQYCIQK